MPLGGAHVRHGLHRLILRGQGSGQRLGHIPDLAVARCQVEWIDRRSSSDRPSASPCHQHPAYAEGVVRRAPRALVLCCCLTPSFLTSPRDMRRPRDEREAPGRRGRAAKAPAPERSKSWQSTRSEGDLGKRQPARIARARHPDLAGLVYITRSLSEGTGGHPVARLHTSVGPGKHPDSVVFLQAFGNRAARLPMPALGSCPYDIFGCEDLTTAAATGSRHHEVTDGPEEEIRDKAPRLTSIVRSAEAPGHRAWWQ